MPVHFVSEEKNVKELSEFKHVALSGLFPGTPDFRWLNEIIQL